MGERAFGMLLIILCLVISISNTVCFAPPSQPAPNTEKIKIFTENQEDGSTESPYAALKQFSQLVSRLSRKFDKKSKHHIHLSYAQVYFNDLYTHGNRETQKALTLLAFELENVLAMRSWSTEKKYLAFNTFLTNALGEVELTLKTKIDKEKLQKLYKHLQAGISPTVVGRQEAIRNLPWVKMSLTAAAVGGGFAAYQSGALGRARKHFIQSFETLGHIGENLKEARRENDAFLENVQHNDEKEAIIKHDISDDGSQHLKYLRKMPENADLKEWISNPSNWIEKPKGLVERLMGAIEAAAPLLPHAKRQLDQATAEQNQWFLRHNIHTNIINRLWVPVTIVDEDGTEKEEMRYAEKDGRELGEGETEESLRRAGYWKQPQTGEWHATHLPPRNIGERVINTADKLIKLVDKPCMQALIERLTTDLNNNETDLLTFLNKHDLLEDGATKPWQLKETVTLTVNPVTKKLVYTIPGKDPVSAPESSFERLITTADKLLTTLEKDDSATGSLVRSITKMMDDGRKETIKWLNDNGLTGADGVLLPEVKIHTDKQTGNVYYTKPKAGAGAGASGATEVEIFRQTSPTSHLFNALGKIASQEHAQIDQILDKVFEEIDYLADDLKAFGEIKLSQLKFGLTTGMTGQKELSQHARLIVHLKYPAEHAQSGLAKAKIHNAQLERDLGVLQEQAKTDPTSKALLKRINLYSKHIAANKLAIETAEAEQASASPLSRR